jgi:hypothetical protein
MGVGLGIQPARDLARRHALRSRLHQQPEYRQTPAMGQGRQAFHRRILFHISWNMELLGESQITV